MLRARARAQQARARQAQERLVQAQQARAQESAQLRAQRAQTLTRAERVRLWAPRPDRHRMRQPGSRARTPRRGISIDACQFTTTKEKRNR